MNPGLVSGAGQTAPAFEPVRRSSPPASPDVFLKLLVAQLRTQNPLEPQKGTEFVTQLAQFNTLEQLIAIRSELVALRQQQAPPSQE
jgi:flagellar basal-body rod modification protein FlgD